MAIRIEEEEKLWKKTFEAAKNVHNQKSLQERIEAILKKKLSGGTSDDAELEILYRQLDDLRYRDVRGTLERISGLRAI